MRTIPSITLDAARATLRAAIDHAVEAGLQMSVAVVDAGGNLMAFERMEDANLCSGEISRNKAYGALAFKARTEDLRKHAEPGGACYGMETSVSSPLAFWGGGVPLKADGIVVGAIGAGGGAPVEDAATADAGAGEFRTDHVLIAGAEPAVVIVGAGAAGCGAARGLRTAGFKGRITVIGAEPGPPYDRPPLSKQVLAGVWEAERIRLIAELHVDEIGADWIHARAAALDRSERAVITADGNRYPYDAVVIATGVEPRRLGFDDLDGVHVLRTLPDALAFRRRLGPGRCLVVVGGGFLGLEAAATARGLGCEVTVVEPLQIPLANRLGELVARRLAALHEQNGVAIFAGQVVQELESEAGVVTAARLTDGSLLAADSVLVAIGTDPRVDWLRESGLTIDDGVLCDEYCLAAPSVWAAGDVARWYHPGIGRHVRFEHRQNAAAQGGAVARCIVGDPTPFAPLSFFWTDHYDAKIQVWGLIPDQPETRFLEGTPDSGSFVVAFHEPGEELPSAVLGWNAAAKLAPYRADLARALERRAQAERQF